MMDNMEYEKAIPLFIDALKVCNNVNHWELHYMLGQCYRLTGDIQNACSSLQKAISRQCRLRECFQNGEVHPKQASAVFQAYGIASQLNEDYYTALDMLKQAIKLNPYSFSSYNSLGITYRRQGRLGEAIECYNHAENLINEVMTKESRAKVQELLPGDPTFAMILNNRGLCKLDTEDFEGAKNDFMLSISETPEGYQYSAPKDNLTQLPQPKKRKWWLGP